MNSASLPLPPPEALHFSNLLQRLIQQEIEAQGGSMPFSQYMEMALYTPDLGYYSGASQKFGQGGDFVTAPEISPLFARMLARQIAQVLPATGGSVLELGAGSGQLAMTLLPELERLDCLPEAYCVLEVSASLRALQQARLQQVLPAHLFARLVWLERLPQAFIGVMIANEVLDAVPVELVINTGDGWLMRGVAWQGGFAWCERPLSPGLLSLLTELHLPVGYITEVAPAVQGLVASLAAMLQHGVLLLVDYGFPAREYYHPQRSQGTLMCHYRHHAHGDPFLYPGLQDITAHVDFSAVANAAMAAGATLAGYASQAQFLINCGITDALAEISPADTAAYLPLVAQAQKLLSPAEMGELFKVIAFSQGHVPALLGFAQGDKRHVL